MAKKYGEMTDKERKVAFKRWEDGEYIDPRSTSLIDSLGLQGVIRTQVFPDRPVLPKFIKLWESRGYTVKPIGVCIVDFGRRQYDYPLHLTKLEEEQENG